MLYTTGGFAFAVSLLLLRWRFVQWPPTPRRLRGFKLVDLYWTLVSAPHQLIVKRILLSTGGVRLY